MPKSFLDLEPHVRDKIYRYSGITRPFCPIDLDKERFRLKYVESFPHHHSNPPDSGYTPCPRGVRYPLPRFPGGFECFCDPVPMQLLLCCRTMYREVAVLLYSQNTFKLLWQDPGRRVLEKLNPSVLPWITSLHVSLGGSNAITWFPRRSADIEALFTIIAKECRPSRLMLTLECQVDDTAGFEVVCHQFQQLSGLRSCAIGLGNSDVASMQQRAKVDDLRERARQMVAFSTGNYLRTDCGLQWWTLPKEIRLKIMHYTDLVFRWRRGWDSDGLVIERGRLLADKGQTRCCQQCCVSPSDTCCCPQFGPSWSSTCTCYSVPRTFLAVSRRFSTEAQEVFFSDNRFVFRDTPPKTLSFFKRQSPPNLALFRKIDFELQLPRDFLDLQLGKDSTFLFDWYELLLYVSEHLNIPALSLSIDTRASFALGQTPESWEQNLPTLLGFFRQIIQPLAQIRCFRDLRSFHVFWVCFQAYEAQAEMEVMGDDYDRATQGKIAYTERNPDFPHGTSRPR